MIPKFPVYLFDVDGTLLDSAPDICGAQLEVLKATSSDGIDEAALRRYIGRHLVETFRGVLPTYSIEQIDDLVRHYRTVYPARDHRMTTVYPGVKEALAALEGRKSTVTTKSTPTTRIVLERFGLIEHFDHVQGTDGFPSKPAPDVILKSIEALSVQPQDCLLVGDSGPDMEAGRRAGVKVCAVRYGYGDPEEMACWNPDYWVSDLRELIS